MGCRGTKAICPDHDSDQWDAGTKIRELEKEIGGVASDFEECTVCFEPLCHQRCGILRQQGQRVCMHLIHLQCAEAMQCAGRFNCPECRASFDSVSPLPRLCKDNTKEWFEAVDASNDGRLSRIEVQQVLKAQFRLDWQKLEQHLESLWSQWDQDGSGYITYHELIASGGLLEYLTGTYVADHFQVPAEHNFSNADECPSLSELDGWFLYWDTDKNGSLDVQEVQRALIKTFNLGGDLGRVHTMHQTLQAVWPVFDYDGSGEISLEEFTTPNGLGQTLLLSLQETDAYKTQRAGTVQMILQSFGG